MEEQTTTRLHAIVEGDVQGVGFRYFVIESARPLGITGWVRNQWNGSVELLAEGECTCLESLVEALHQGPRSAHVTSVSTVWQPATGEFTGFNIRYTGV